MSITYKYIHILLLAAYVASLLFGNLRISSETSLSFVLGALWGISKLWSLLSHDRTFRLEAEGALLIFLYVYLAGVDALVHGGSLHRHYYISFGLNCLMTLLLIDEFSKSIWLREKMMQVFSAAAVLVATLFLAGICITKSQSGRLTFMGQNENDLALNFLIAVTFLTVDFVRSARTKLPSLALMYVSTILLFNALISTGSRSAMFSVCVVLLILIVATLKHQKAVKSCLAYISVCVIFFGFKTLNFQPALERLSPTIYGNNLTDLGGRIPLWESSIDAISAHPFVGMGYDGFESHVLQTEKYFGMPHNFFLEVAAMGGLCGIVLLFILGYLLMARAVLQLVRLGLLEGFIWLVPIFVTSAMFNITHMKAFWFLVAYFVAVTSSAQKNANGGAAGHHVI